MRWITFSSLPCRGMIIRGRAAPTPSCNASSPLLHKQQLLYLHALLGWFGRILQMPDLLHSLTLRASVRSPLSSLSGSVAKERSHLRSCFRLPFGGQRKGRFLRVCWPITAPALGRRPALSNPFQICSDLCDCCIGKPLDLA
jgi:hypothetical protein